jgi:hypothetical protein
MTNHDFADQLDSLLLGNLSKWKGLPIISITELEDLLGRTGESKTARLGAYPAQRLEFPHQRGDRTLIAYARHGQIVMVEMLPPPDSSALSGLPQPTAILPQEISVEGAYAHEYLYCERGLLLTVAQSFGRPEPDRLIRCRGIRPMLDRSQLGPELYMPLDTEVNW